MTRRQKSAPPESRPAPEGRLSGLRPHVHDEDEERPTREQRGSDRSMFDIPVRIPKLFTRGKSRSGE